MKSNKYILLFLLVSNSVFGQLSCPIITSDIKVCPNTNAQLNVSGANFYTWTPSAGLSNPNISNPIVNVPVTTTYSVTGFTETTTNLIVNGNFSAVKTGFNSDYIYPKSLNSTCLQPEGYYVIGKNPHDYHPNFSVCSDHTSGSGYMMVVNGNTVANSKVWTQDITVKANTWYAFYAYLTPVHPTNPPTLQFSINGSVIGTPFTSSNTTCNWQQFYAIWYSGSTTNATISIVNQNTIASGNDFALDDIKFVELCQSTNTVTVTVPNLTSTTNIKVCSTLLPYNWNGTIYNSTGIYTKHLPSVLGCDSIATLNLSVNVPTSSITNASICPGGSYTFNGISYNVAGTYSTTLTNAQGCDSIATLNLSVNVSTSSITNASICQGNSYIFNGTSYSSAGTYTKTLVNNIGCDSIATLNLTVNVPTGSTINASICQGSLYLFNGTSYNTTGIYTKKLTNAAGCDSVATLNLTVNVSTSSITNASICQGNSYIFNGTSYSSAGTYTKTLVNTIGCDSIATLNLTVNVPTSSTTNASICQGSLYLFNGTSYNTTGIYTKKLTNAAGCDSVATLNLTVNVPTSSITNASICQGNSYIFNGTTYTAAGTYSKILINTVGCDSIATLNLKVNIPTSSTTNASICQGSSYLFNGTSYSTTGTYTKTLINAAGCDSIATLNLTVNVPTASTTNASICQGSSYTFNGSTYNASGIYSKTLMNASGCDSIATLNLTVNVPTSSTTNASICQGGSYLFNGTSYNTTGTYTKILTNAAGCDSIATLNLTVNIPTSSITNAFICQGGSYTFNGSTYTVAGTYTKTLVNAVGCDSVATLNLTVNVPTSSTTNASICQGGSYLFNGTSYNTTGTYTKILTNAAGCDSIATLNLTVNIPTSSIINASICQGSSYLFNGTSFSTAGTYSKTLINVAGCDSIATLNLTVNIPTSSIINASICQGSSYLFNGTSYNTTGTYTKTLINAAVCDSIVTLNLSVNVPTGSTTNVSICPGGSYTFNGISYNVAGTYSKTLTTAFGCDSIATLNLSVNVPTSSITNASICPGGSYTFNGISYNVAGTYSKTLTNAFGCDSIATLNLSVNVPTSSTTNASICPGGSYTFNGISYNVAGTYSKTLTTAFGCDSIATLNLSVNVPTSSTTNASICPGGSYIFNGTSYNVVGSYSKTLTNAQGCDSIATLHLTVNVPTSSTTNASICQGSSYLFNGTSYNTTGTYTKTLINVAGCDSIATLHLTVNVPTSSTTNASICQGSSYLFNGTSYNTTGTYTKILTNATGCDSIATLNLTVNIPTSSITNAFICQGGSYTFNGSTYTVAGTYTKTLVNAVGCDSVATLNLTVNVPTSSITNASICPGGSYAFNGSAYTIAGTYTKTLVNAVGCDSVATLNLTVNVPKSSITNASICPGGSYTFNGSAYTIAGTYTKTLINTVGCDSIATLNLTVNVPTSSITNVSVCQGEKYSFNGMSYLLTGTYVAHLTNAAGCDSIATLYLTVNVPTCSTIEASISEEDMRHNEGYMFNGTIYRQVGTYVVRLNNAAGCDSIATLILKARAYSTQATKVTLCSSELPYLWNGTSYKTTGIYTKTLKNIMGADSIVTLDITVLNSTSSLIKAAVCSGNTYYFNGSNYSKAGIYVSRLNNSVGCDSIATLELTVDTVYNTAQTVQLFSGEKFTVNEHIYDQAGTYIDVVKSNNDCESTIVTEITVIDLPNAFTPNGDGVNDEFMKDWHVQIYNRNGILLYEGYDGWDGKYNGKPVTKDTYFFILYYLHDTKTKTKEGYVMLIR